MAAHLFTVEAANELLVTYPNMLEWFEELGLEMEISDMSLSVSTQLPGGGRCEWGSGNGLSGLLAQKSNALRPAFWHMIRETLKFKEDALSYVEDHEKNPHLDQHETLGQFIQTHGYSQLFQEASLPDPNLCKHMAMPFAGGARLLGFRRPLLLPQRSPPSDFRSTSVAHRQRSFAYICKQGKGRISGL
ncbi:Cyclopropane-fatty-acyl-phospholipid synthase [Hordeum vulgare]|nr:Cyclopropane-fatty-acyl-phospholipid synthase [Hordeum vulgare]